MWTFVILVLFVLLFISFVTLTMHEKKMGVRMYGTFRNRVDERLQALIDLREKVSLRIVIVHVLQSLIRRFMHDVLKVALAALAAMERALRRIGSYMHSKAVSAPSLYAKTHVSEALTHLKRTLSPQKEADEKFDKVE